MFFLHIWAESTVRQRKINSDLLLYTGQHAAGLTQRSEPDFLVCLFPHNYMTWERAYASLFSWRYFKVGKLYLIFLISRSRSAISMGMKFLRQYFSESQETKRKLKQTKTDVYWLKKETRRYEQNIVLWVASCIY